MAKQPRATSYTTAMRGHSDFSGAVYRNHRTGISHVTNAQRGAYWVNLVWRIPGFNYNLRLIILVQTMQDWDTIHDRLSHTCYDIMTSSRLYFQHPFHTHNLSGKQILAGALFSNHLITVQCPPSDLPYCTIPDRKNCYPFRNIQTWQRSTQKSLLATCHLCPFGRRTV